MQLEELGTARWLRWPWCHPSQGRNTDVRAPAWHSSSWSLLWEFAEELNNSFSVAYDEKGKPAVIGVWKQLTSSSRESLLCWLCMDRWRRTIPWFWTQHLQRGWAPPEGGWGGVCTVLPGSRMKLASETEQVRIVIPAYLKVLGAVSEVLSVLWCWAGALILWALVFCSLFCSRGIAQSMEQTIANLQNDPGVNKDNCLRMPRNPPHGKREGAFKP